jgi:zinc protease
MTLDRTSAPDFKQVEHIELLKTTPIVLDNGLKVFKLDAGEQEIVRIEFVFENTLWDPFKPLQAFGANSLIIEGTSKLKSADIAERIDFYGAFLQTDYSYDQSTITLYTLNKHLEATLPVINEIIKDAVFPEEELDTFIRNQKQKLSVNLEKNDFVGRRVFSNVIFGDSAYGYTITAEDYDSLTRDHLIDYYKKSYQATNCTIVISGKVTDKSIGLLNNYFGKDWPSNEPVVKSAAGFSIGNGDLHYIEKEDALQSAIRLGKVSINRTHPDFPALQVLNTLLGGYFGSRLMANIREDKGYTYGIGSALISLQNAGYFFIASEVGSEVCTSAMEEIEKEVSALRRELVSNEELNLVKNYMLGSMLGGLENAFSHADKFKNVYFQGLNYNYYDYYIHTVKTVSPVKLLELADKYLDFKTMEKVIVGKM